MKINLRMLKSANETLNDIFVKFILKVPAYIFGSGKIMTISFTSVIDSSIVSGKEN